MPSFKVGELYNPKVKQWPEGTQYNFRRGQHELLLFFAGPSAREVTAVRNGEAEFALYAEGPLLVLLYRFGAPGEGVPWSDATYAWHLAEPAERDLPSADLEARFRALLQVMLIDADSGVLRAIRALSLGHEFTVALHGAIRAQAAQPWDSAAFDRAVDRLYARYQTTEELLAVAQHRTLGGA